ncbi:MAG TPA: IS1595 family transposase [Methylocystis sp.]|jgi:transposase-like protein
MVDLTAPIFTDAEAARRHLEAQVWPNGPVCPHCGNADGERITALKGKSHRAGLYQCMECREQFTVTVGSAFERSKIPLNKWLLATYLLNASKKGYSAHQLHRTLGVTYKTAWFMFHRIREAMKDDVSTSGPLGGEGKIVEADETYHGKKETVTKRTKRGKPSHSSKRSIVALVERGGRVRSFHVETATKDTVREILVTNASRASKLHTDESNLYMAVGKEFAGHESVTHSADEYVRGDVHTNTIEGFFSIFKRGMRGVYQHCSEKHLHRYLVEFDHRYNHRVKLGFDDAMRADKALAGIKGRRLYYRRPDEAANA